jgi:hypothetical protein
LPDDAAIEERSMSLRESARLLGSTAPQPCLFKKPAETKAQRDKRLAKEKAARLALRQRFVTDDDCILSFKEWCALVGISVRAGRRIIADPTKRPKLTYLTAKRYGIAMRDHRAWQQSRAR